jgi:VanZ family protein
MSSAPACRGIFFGPVRPVGASIRRDADTMSLHDHPPARGLAHWLRTAILAEHPWAVSGWRGLLALLLCAVTLLALSPVPPKGADFGGDKINHLLAFGTLGVVAALAWRRTRWPVAAALLAYGGLIELLQSFTPRRQAEWADLLADAIGIALGLLLAALLLRWARRRPPADHRMRED